MRRAVLLPFLLATLTTGCGDSGSPAAVGPPAVSAGAGQPSVGAVPDASTGVSDAPDGGQSTSGTFAAYTDGAASITYDPAVVPAGSSATVAVTPTSSGVTVRLTVAGMLPNRPYGAHLHTNACAATAAQAGPHYQHDPDPAAGASAPSVDPRYANPANEVWLDFRTDATGAAIAIATQSRSFDAVKPPRSLVIHANPTATGPGKAGTAGPRAACLSLSD